MRELINVMPTLFTTSFVKALPLPQSLITSPRMNIITGFCNPSPMLPKVPNNMNNMCTRSAYLKMLSLAPISNAPSSLSGQLFCYYFHPDIQMYPIVIYAQLTPLRISAAYYTIICNIVFFIIAIVNVNLTASMGFLKYSRHWSIILVYRPTFLFVSIVPIRNFTRYINFLSNFTVYLFACSYLHSIRIICCDCR